MFETGRFLRKLFLVLLFCGAGLFSGCDAFYGGDTSHPLFRKAVRQRAAGEYAEAARTMKAFLAVRPESAQGHLVLASICDENLQDMVGALYHYREFLTLAPESPEAGDVRSWVRSCELRLQSLLSRDALNVKLRAENSRLRLTVAQYHRKTVQLQEELELARTALSEAKSAAVAMEEKEKNRPAPPAPTEKTVVPPPAGSVESAPPRRIASAPEESNPLDTLFPGVAPEKLIPALTNSSPLPEHSETEAVKREETAVPATPKPEPMEESASTAVPAQPEWPKTYRVCPGDSLSAISRKFYGTAQLYGYIMKANRISNSKSLMAGQILTLPEPPAKEEGKQ